MTPNRASATTYGARDAVSYSGLGQNTRAGKGPSSATRAETLPAPTGTPPVSDDLGATNDPLGVYVG